MADGSEECIHELQRAQCALCNGAEKRNAGCFEDRSVQAAVKQWAVGPVESRSKYPPHLIAASYAGTCPSCDYRYSVGEAIGRQELDGEIRWVCGDCANIDAWTAGG